VTPAALLARRKAALEQPDALDAAALATIATRRYVLRAEFLSQLAGAPQAASATGGFYAPYLNNIANPNGNPATATYLQQTEQAFQPTFQQQDQQNTDRLNAMGIQDSGAAKNDTQQLQQQQSAQVAGAEAPFYGTAEADYGALLGAQAGSEAGAYTGAQQQFYDLLKNVGQAAATAAAGA
jgi:hypothetical protein